MKRSNERRIVTADNFELEVTPAGIAKRGVAVSVDFALVSMIVGTALTFLQIILPHSVVFAIGAFLGVFGTIAYAAWGDLKNRGQTFGKTLMRVRVVDSRGLPLTLAQSLARNVARSVDFLPFFYGAGGLVALVDPWRRRAGDFVASTLVVEEREHETAFVAPVMEWRETTLRRAALRRRAREILLPDEIDFVQELLSRERNLNPKARHDLMESAGAHLRARLQIPEVPGLSGANFVKILADAMDDRGVSQKPKPAR